MSPLASQIAGRLILNCVRRVLLGALVVSFLLSPGAVSAAGVGVDSDGNRTSRISDDSIPELDVKSFPTRPSPILELGNPFLASGNIRKGIELPGGAIWQPSLVVFGTYRNAFQSFRFADETHSEWANRLDLFANLQLSGSERFLIGFRPLDEEGRFTSYQFESGAIGDASGWNNEINSEVTTAFFEGDLGEMFPTLDTADTRNLDLGFAVGRQPLNYQEGLLLNDIVDAIGVTRNTLLPTGGSDLQATFIYGWDNVHRNDNRRGQDQKLYALVFAADYPSTTLNADFIYIDDQEGRSDGFFWGLSDVRRIGHYNVSTRLLGSHALKEESPAVSNGNLIFVEVSWTPPWTHDHVYVNGFVAIDEFASASRDPSSGGPLGRTGILFRNAGLGRSIGALDTRATQTIGGALGYQWFISPVRNQVIFELGMRLDESERTNRSIGAGVRYRHVFGQHVLINIDGFTALNSSTENNFGLRAEMRLEF